MAFFVHRNVIKEKLHTLSTAFLTPSTELTINDSRKVKEALTNNLKMFNMT